MPAVELTPMEVDVLDSMRALGRRCTSNELMDDTGRSRAQVCDALRLLRAGGHVVRVVVEPLGGSAVRYWREVAQVSHTSA